MNQIISAGCLIIGDEILSGRTKEANSGFLAEALTSCAIDLKEIRIVSDDESDIIKAVTALSSRYSYVFTSGGIGPTHDDITAQAIARAFDRELQLDPRAVAILEPYYASKDLEFNAARQQMARIPSGAELIENPISKAPGFIVENVHVMAGVPNIFKAMLANILPTLKTGIPIHTSVVTSPKPEGVIGVGLSQIQSKFPDVSIGSYPTYNEKSGFSVEIVIRSRNELDLASAEKAIREFVASCE